MACGHTDGLRSPPPPLSPSPPQQPGPSRPRMAGGRWPHREAVPGSGPAQPGSARWHRGTGGGTARPRPGACAAGPGGLEAAAGPTPGGLRGRGCPPGPPPPQPGPGASVRGLEASGGRGCPVRPGRGGWVGSGVLAAPGAAAGTAPAPQGSRSTRVERFPVCLATELPGKGALGAVFTVTSGVYFRLLHRNITF